MKINDRVYGQIEIDIPVITELFQCKALLRLKRINQAGTSQYLFSWKDVTRFEHSVGVMLLLRRFGASIEEQIAGLLHDLPHTAFSHVIDFVFENEKHEFHEQYHEKIINEPEISDILHKHQIPKTVAHPENFSLLERNLPDLCADRIDYAFRDYLCWKKDKQGIEAQLSGLTVLNNEFVFNNVYAAEAFSLNYLGQDKHSWADPRETATYVIMAQAIRHALDKNILTIKDLFTDDETVYQILEKKGDPYILKKLSYLTPAFNITLATKEHHHLSIKTKLRYIDPKVIIKGKTQRLSEISKHYKNKLDEHIKTSNKGWYVFINRG